MPLQGRWIHTRATFHNPVFVHPDFDLRRHRILSRIGAYRMAPRHANLFRWLRFSAYGALAICCVILAACSSPSTNSAKRSASTSARVQHSATPAQAASAWRLRTELNTQGSAWGQMVLTGISASASNNVWAVGSTGERDIDPTTAVAIRWDGAEWNYYSPYGDGQNAVFHAVVALSPDDVWAVGQATEPASSPPGVIERWNGSQWGLVAHPLSAANIGQGVSLTAIAAISPDDIWTVGYGGVSRLENVIDAPVAEHWNGSSWRQVSVPFDGACYDAELSGLVAITSDDVWAVGMCTKVSERDDPDHASRSTLIEHWDGAKWSIVPSPNPAPRPGGNIAALRSIAAVSAQDVWAAGYSASGLHYSGTSGPDQPLVEHWNGAQWQITPTPPDPTLAGGNSIQLSGITVASSGTVWAVGTACFNCATSPVTFIMEWDGARWAQVPSPNTADPRTASPDVPLPCELASATSTPDGQVWAAGDCQDPTVIQVNPAHEALVESYG